MVQYQNVNYDIENMHTKQLLRLLRSLYSVDNCWEYTGDKFIKICKEHDEFRSIIKLELSKREHIPNKKESKKIRKQKIVRQKNLKQKKYINH